MVERLPNILAHVSKLATSTVFPVKEKNIIYFHCRKNNVIFILTYIINNNNQLLINVLKAKIKIYSNIVDI